MKKIDCRSSSDLDWDVTEDGLYLLDFGWEESPLDVDDEMRFSASLLAVEEFAKRGGEGARPVFARDPIDLCIDLDAFSDYLDRLAAPLDEEVVPLILIEKNECIPETIVSYCKRRFQAFELLHKGLPIGNEALVGIVLGQDDAIDLQWLAEQMGRFEDYTCIPEELLNEYWGGVDQLVVDENALSEKGRRMLLGFEAAGGVIKISE